jgi:hypothetical protein
MQIPSLSKLPESIHREDQEVECLQKIIAQTVIIPQVTTMELVTETKNIEQLLKNVPLKVLVIPMKKIMPICSPVNETLPQ